MTGEIGIAGLGIFMPATVVTAEMLAGETGIPAPVLREKFGVHQVRRAGPDLHVSQMAAAAGRAALDDAGVAPDEVDLLIYYGSEYKDYIVWSGAAHISHLLGCRHVQAFEIYALCAGTPIALRVARNMMLGEPDLLTALVVAASKESELVDRQNPRTRFMSNFGDGAAAAVLRRGLRRNQVLASAAITEGSLSDAAIVPAGGSRHPASADTVGQGLHRLDVPDLDDMRARLDAVSGTNFVETVRQALHLSGRPRVDFLAAVHMKRSMHDWLLTELGRPRHLYLEEFGHMQAADQLVVLHEARARGLLRGGDTVALVAAGVGYTWAATIMTWGESAQ